MSTRVLKLIPTAFPFQLLSDLHNCNAVLFILITIMLMFDLQKVSLFTPGEYMHNTVHSLKSQRDPGECIAFSRAFLPYLRAVTCLFSQFQQRLRSLDPC